MDKDRLREFLLYTQAIMTSMRNSVEGDEKNVWRFSSYREYMRKYIQLFNEVNEILPINSLVDLYHLEAVPTETKTIAVQQKTYFDSVFTNLSILKSFLESKLDFQENEVNNLKNFVQINLRRVIMKEPEDENDIQNGIEQLLIGKGMSKGIDYDRETGRVKVSIKEVVPDFIFPRLSLALEVKFCKNKSKAKAIVDEINSDIRAYAKGYSQQIFVVYDMASIRDESEFKQDIENQKDVHLVIVKN